MLEMIGRYLGNFSMVVDHNSNQGHKFPYNFQRFWNFKKILERSQRFKRFWWDHKDSDMQLFSDKIPNDLRVFKASEKISEIPKRFQRLPRNSKDSDMITEILETHKDSRKIPTKLHAVPKLIFPSFKQFYYVTRYLYTR